MTGTECYVHSASMASRVIEVGTIVSRTRFLLQSGVLQKPPLWLEVVEAFPPLLTSQYNRKAEPGQPPSLSYPEDTLRKEFHEKYEVARAKEEPISLYEEEMQPTVCERFVHEQQVKLQSGVGKEEAARGAFWTVRNSGVDIRLKERTKRTGTLAAKGAFHNVQNLLKELHHTSQKS